MWICRLSVNKHPFRLLDSELVFNSRLVFKRPGWEFKLGQLAGPIAGFRRKREKLGNDVAYFPRHEEQPNSFFHLGNSLSLFTLPCHTTMSSDNAPVNAANPEVAPVQSSADAPAQEGAPAPAGPSKSELKKRAKEAEKAKKAAERAAREEEERRKREAKESEDHAKQNYGKLPLHQSQERNGES